MNDRRLVDESVERRYDRRAPFGDVAVCGQLEGADAAAGPIVEPAENDLGVCSTVAPKVPAVDAGAEPSSMAGIGVELQYYEISEPSDRQKLNH